jgi:benzoate/toluate 1,2-dioxygenase beta subunit
MSSSDLWYATMQFLGREAANLDDQKWDEWIGLFAEDCEYWVPTWRKDGTLTEDPKRELSHIYYANRSGLEDRILRIRSRLSPASMPLMRTTHVLGNVLIEEAREDRVLARISWVNHIYNVRTKASHEYFGSSQYLLSLQGGAPSRILKKKVMIQNDIIQAVVDIYCL